MLDSKLLCCHNGWVVVAYVWSRCIGIIFQHGFFEARFVYESSPIFFLIVLFALFDIFIAMVAVSGGAIHPEPVHAVWQIKRYGILRMSAYQTRGLLRVHCDGVCWITTPLLIYHATRRWKSKSQQQLLQGWIALHTPV